MKHNIIYNRTLSEYNKKYGSKSHKLLKFTRKEVEDFDKKNGYYKLNKKTLKLKYKNFLLLDHKWWFIEETNTYYEQPQKQKKAILASLLGLFLVAGTTLGVGEGVYHWFSGGGDKPQPVPPVPVEQVKITFDANGGQFDSTSETTISKVVDKGSKWSQIKSDAPKASKTDCDFAGYTFSDGTTTITDDYVFETDTTLKLKYDLKQFTVTFIGNGGKWGEDTVKTVKVPIHTKWNEIVYSKYYNYYPRYAKHIFKCWSEDGETETKIVEITKDVTFKALYHDAVTITFDPNGGTWDGTTTYTIDVIKNTLWEKVENKPANPTKTDADGNTSPFNYWETSEGAQINDGYKFDDNKTLKANWGTAVTDLFVKASWEEIVNTIESGGFAGLVNKYRSGVASPTFVNAERTVLVDDGSSNEAKAYKVRVVDEQADDVKVVSGGNHAVLTFEFEDVINIEDVQFSTTTSNNAVSNAWANSNVRNLLNEGGNIFTKITEKLDNDKPSSPLLSTKFMPALKKTNSSGSITTEDKLFLPSLSEIGVKKIPGTGVDVDNEGYVYKKYNSGVNSYVKQKDGQNYDYWLRSDDADEPSNVWYVDKNGSVGGEEGKPTEEPYTKPTSKVATSKLGIAPCFCLGNTTNDISVSFSNGGDSTITITGEQTTFNTTKNKTYTAFKKDITLPVATKNSTQDNDYDFKYWYYLNGKTKVEITEDYLLQDYNLILYPEFEAKPKDYKPGITFELINGKTNPVNVTFSTTISDSVKKPKLFYSKDDGKNYTLVDWTKDESQRTIVVDSNNPKLTISSNNEDNTTYGLSQSKDYYTKIKVDEDNNNKGGRVSLSGDLRTLLKASAYSTVTEASAYCFYNLFGGDYGGDDPGDLVPESKNKINITESHTGIEDASNLKLGVTTTNDCSFKKMFQCSENLINAPKILNPTKLKGIETYFGCFGCCTSLVEAPILPDISEIGTWTYYKMFHYCKSLKVGPKLFSSKLHTWAYGSMFKYCINLLTAPELPDNIELTEGDTEQLCGMFFGCRSLIIAPKKISATKLTNASCRDMFNDCQLLEVGPEIYAETYYSGAKDDYGSLFQMFKDCIALKYVKVYINDITLQSNCCKNWMSGVPSSSDCIFECPSTTTTSATRSVNGIPDGWTIKTFQEQVS